MKLIFFLIAFFLVSIRVYFSWSGMEKAKRGESETNLVIKSDGFYEEMNYDGKFQLNEDETGFKSISPGGYFKFRRNEIKVKAEGNLKGDVDYMIYDGKSNLPLNEEGKRLLAQAIREMIFWGYDAKNRMARIYQRGGPSALLSEVDSMKSDEVKVMYLEFLLAIDSLHPEVLPVLIKKAGSMGSDVNKEKFLLKISSLPLRNNQTDSTCFEMIKGFGSDMDKLSSLQYFMDKDSFNEKNIQRIMSMSGSLGSDVDKANLLHKIIERRLINGPLYDSLLEYISQIGSDHDKGDLYRELSGYKTLSDIQWMKLLDKISTFGSDVEKSELLIGLVQNMPKTDAVKLSYQKAAKTIGNDNDYGRAMRAIQ